jgi:predicted dehydrogenase
MQRRDFLRKTCYSAGMMFLAPKIDLFSHQSSTKVRLGFIGVGLRGRNHLEQVLYRNDVEVGAICDIDPAAIAEAQQILTQFKHKAPMVYQNGPQDFERLLKQEELDAVVIATPWEWHAPQAVFAMKHGKHVGLEVPAALTVKECWDLVNTSEKTGKQLMMLENVCYRRDVMAVLNMVKQGMFGELVHLQGGYQHDLREVKFNDGKQPYGGGVEFGEKGFSEARWRTQHAVNRNGDLYPTHGLGPVAQMSNINRGNQFLYLSSFATQSRGLHEYIVKKGGQEHPNAQVQFKLGDVVTTLIKCANGQTIQLSHDTNLPRPYSLNFRVQGTQGIWMDDNRSIYLEGVSAKAHSWEAAKPYLEKYDHPAWKQYEKEAENAGHGGMDFFVIKDFIDCVRDKKPFPIDVYDAAAWSVIGPLSEKSIANKSASVAVPDFTRGRWKTRSA